MSRCQRPRYFQKNERTLEQSVRQLFFFIAFNATENGKGYKKTLQEETQTVTRTSSVPDILREAVDSGRYQGTALCWRSKERPRKGLVLAIASFQICKEFSGIACCYGVTC